MISIQGLNRDACDIAAEQVTLKASLAAAPATATATAAATPRAASQGSATAPTAGKPHSLAGIDEALVALTLGVGLRAGSASAQTIQHRQLSIPLRGCVDLVRRELSAPESVS